MMFEQENSPAAIYRKLEPDRLVYENRAEACAAVTIPSLFSRPEAHPDSREFPSPFQSAGAHGVNHLSSAMTLGLLPPGHPMARLQLEAAAKAELRALQEGSGGRQKPLSEVEAALAVWERAIFAEIERANYRTPTEQMCRMLLVTGNVLVEHLPEGGMRLHKLHSYVVQRNPDGSLYRLVLKERMREEQVPVEVLDHLDSREELGATRDGFHDIYTLVEFGRGRYRVTQQIGGVVMDVDEMREEGDEADCPFLPMRFRVHDGEHYGRGLVEEYYGDIASAETLTQAVVEAAAASAKVLFMVNPGSVTRPTALAKAKNLGFVAGRAEDVTTLQVNKQADMAVAYQMLENLHAQLNRAFVIAEVRDAERVTTEEIRFVQEQLERAQGGVFSQIAQDFQVKVVRHAMKRLERRNALPPLPDEMVEPVIVTGVHALGRSTEARKLVAFLATVGQTLGPQTVQTFVDVSEVLSRLAAADGIDPSGLIRSQEQIAQMQAEAQRQAMVSQLGETAIKTGGEVVKGAALRPVPENPAAAAA